MNVWRWMQAIGFGFAALLLSASAVSGYVPSGPVLYVYGTDTPGPHSFSTGTSTHSRNPLVPYGIAITTNLATLPVAYDKLVSTWGRPSGKFHLKQDWSGDLLAQSDEVSHLFVSYKLTNYLYHGCKAIGFSEKGARLWSITEAAFLATAVEFPVDAFNPTQGMGVSDLVFDYAGVALGYLKIADRRFDRWDLKVSAKSLSHSSRQLIGNGGRDYDNYIYWLTYRRTPALVGLGFSTNHAPDNSPAQELYLGVGTTVPDLVRPLGRRLSQALSFLEFYYFNLRFKLYDSR